MRRAPQEGQNPRRLQLKASSLSWPHSPQRSRQYATLVSLVTPATAPRTVVNDADDDHVIAAAVVARAELIVTGDRKHLLPIGSHQGIAIVTAREAVEQLTVRGV